MWGLLFFMRQISHSGEGISGKQLIRGVQFGTIPVKRHLIVWNFTKEARQSVGKGEMQERSVPRNRVGEIGCFISVNCLVIWRGRKRSLENKDLSEYRIRTFFHRYLPSAAVHNCWESFWEIIWVCQWFGNAIHSTNHRPEITVCTYIQEGSNQSRDRLRKRNMTSPPAADHESLPPHQSAPLMGWIHGSCVPIQQDTMSEEDTAQRWPQDSVPVNPAWLWEYITFVPITSYASTIRE